MLRKVHLIKWLMYKKYIKRLLDIIISFILIVILFPIFVIMFIITKLEFSGKAIFKQERIGLNEKTYTIYKFKTMKDDTKEVTKLSRFIRRVGLDELPQLFNVLKGDMSLIGPRPFIVDDPLPIMYDKKRHTVKPGITGLSQVSGRREITHKRKLELDNEYVNNISFKLDLYIFFKTFIVILKK